MDKTWVECYNSECRYNDKFHHKCRLEKIYINSDIVCANFGESDK